jgi:polyphosphate kinase
MDKPAENASPSFPCLNRDLSWVDFNERVLGEGLRKDLPLLERFRFLSIVSSNFDEFFMVRVAALKRLLHSDTAGLAADPSGLTPAQQLKKISEKVHAVMVRHYDCLMNEILPGLAKNGLTLLRPDSCSVPQLDFLESYFMGQVYPVLTPLRLEDDKPMPFIENRLLHAAFLLVPETPASDTPETPGAAQEEQKIVIPLPPALNRIIWLPGPGNMTANEHEKGMLHLILLEDVVLTWGSYLFPGFRIKGLIGKMQHNIALTDTIPNRRFLAEVCCRLYFPGFFDQFFKARYTCQLQKIDSVKRTVKFIKIIGVQ